tara:strand:- start:29216 stop:29791 length:576 start_codon:yes stop_codon:yes gene_type:complete
MRKIVFLFILSVVSLVGCKSSKHAKNETTTKVIIDNRTEKIGQNTVLKNQTDNTATNQPVELPHNKTFDIINYAKQFEGVKYKWGGTTDKGMDCSGLVFEAFKAYDIYLPRISRDMAKQGKKIKLKQTQTGDLLFFKTKNRRNDINHVGLVVDIKDNTILFIHATTSGGVLISSLNETYWLNVFEEVRRVL